MADLFKKLNTLLKSSINDVIGDQKSSDPRRRGFVLGKDIDREVNHLRQRINEAVAYENNLQAKVLSIQDEIARLDEQADDAVRAGNDAQARYLIEQVQRTRQRLVMAESDVREHQLVTQDLIQRVNLLEAAVADARRSQQQSAPPASSSTAPEMPAELSNVAPLERSMNALSDVLRDAREKITGMNDTLNAQQEVQEALNPVEPVTSQAEIDDDLAARRERLSKR
jgi:phage shock protein A